MIFLLSISYKTPTMKNLFTLIIFTIICYSAESQISFDQLNLNFGDYHVGFQHTVEYDHSRTYQKKMQWDHEFTSRPLEISLWFPAEKSAHSERFDIANYLEILKREEEWESLPTEQILNWFAYPNTVKNRQLLKEKTKAFHFANPIEKKFPAVIYAPSYEASSVENFAMCEFLASHGYVVIAVTSKGESHRRIGREIVKGLEAQTRDLEFLLGRLHQMPNVNTKKIGTMGFSFGGLSNVLLQMRNKHIKAIVSLDGTIRYNYGALKKHPSANVLQVDVPFIHFAQKEIPKDILESDKIDPKLNTEFLFYNELKYSDAYKIRMKNMTHMNFASLDIFLRERDKRQDKSDREILESYKVVSEYTLNFLNAYLKNDEKALPLLKKKAYSSLLTIEHKSALSTPFTFRDFHELAKKQNYQALEKLFENVKKSHSRFEIPEGQLNQLGLQLVFNPKVSKNGIAIFELATKLYPKSGNLFDSLAEGYLFIGDKKNAIRNFKKSLELSPSNQNAIRRLNTLK